MSGENATMSLIGIAMTLVAGLVAVILTKAGHSADRAVADLGTVSPGWIAEHRTER
jgi:hypothetical protein